MVNTKFYIGLINQLDSQKGAKTEFIGTVFGRFNRFFDLILLILAKIVTNKFLKLTDLTVIFKFYLSQTIFVLLRNTLDFYVSLKQVNY